MCWRDLSCSRESEKPCFGAGIRRTEKPCFAAGIRESEKPCFGDGIFKWKIALL